MSGVGYPIREILRPEICLASRAALVLPDVEMRGRVDDTRGGFEVASEQLIPLPADGIEAPHIPKALFGVAKKTRHDGPDLPA